MRKARKFYYELEKIYEKNENFLTISLQLFSYFLDYNKEQEILEKLLSLNSKNKINISKYLFLSNYSHKWSQEEYLTQILKYSEFFPKYNVKKISRINYKDNKKINIGLLENQKEIITLVEWPEKIDNKIDNKDFAKILPHLLEKTGVLNIGGLRQTIFNFAKKVFLLFEKVEVDVSLLTKNILFDLIQTYR